MADKTKEKLFKEKLSLLNADFYDFIGSAIKENSAYDFTPSVTDYINHVKELDQLYAPPPERKVLKAKRRHTNGAVAQPKPQPVVAKAVGEERKENQSKSIFAGFNRDTNSEKKESTSSAVPATQFSFAPKVNTVDMNKFATFSAPKATAPTASSTPLSSNRKRRPDAELDYDDMKKTSSAEYGNADEDVAPKPTTNLPSFLMKPATDSSKSSGLFETKSSPSVPPILSFKSQNDSKKDDSATESKTTASLPTFTLNGGSGSAAPVSTTGASFLFKGTTTASSGSGSSMPSAPLFGSSLFGSTSTTKTGTSSLFAGMSTFAPAKTNIFKDLNGSSSSTGTTSATTTTATGSSSLFGSLPTTGGPLTFSFSSSTPATNENAAVTNGSGDAKGDEGEDEGPPPEFVAVKTDEPDAVFSTKCCLHNFTDGAYNKIGIGYIYVKKSDKGAHLLVRSATAIGAIWINTYINSDFKVQEKGKDKIQFSYPTADGIKTHLVKVVDYAECLAYFKGEKKP